MKIRRTVRWSDSWRVGLLLITSLGVSSAVAAASLLTSLGIVAALHERRGEHLDQHDLVTLVQNNQGEDAFTEAFEHGDELFETAFNALDGVGANVGQGQRFTRIPRADLTGPGEWANHSPSRATGPNAQACNSCHREPTDDGSGSIAENVHRDPLHSGSLGRMIQRSTPHMFGAGAVQRLAEEMTETLQRSRDEAIQRACASAQPVRRNLSAKGISFGTLTVFRTASRPCATRVDTSGVVGVDKDLIVRSFQWKGSVAFLRDFNRDAAHNELGMQAAELVGDGVDGDADGVVDEMSVGDQTGLAIYLAAQPRPTSKQELAALGLIEPLTSAESAAIDRGREAFRRAQCSTCHTPQLLLSDPLFSEPSQNPSYRDRRFPSGQDPASRGVSPQFPITFDLTQDQPDNVLTDALGQVTFRLGSFTKDTNGRAIVELFGDLKRHDLGSALAESIDETGSGASMFLTENLWGVGSTAPYMHDGRATTLAEAILAHGGEAASSRIAFSSMPLQDQRDLVAFLDNLVLFKK